MKPHLSLADQFELLVSRGLEVDNAQDFTRFLGEQNYYRLRGYFHPFLLEYEGSKSDQFKPRTSGKTIQALVEFDRKLRVLLYEALAVFETQFRSSLAYHAGKVSTFIHIESDHFTREFTNIAIGEGSSAYDKWLTSYESSLHKQRTNEIVRWHKQARDGKLPIWAAVEILDFGKISRLYRGFEEELATAIANDFSEKAVFLKGAVASLNDLRNYVAHHSRIWNLHYPVNPTLRASKLPQELLHLRHQEDYEQHKLFTRLSLLLWFDKNRSFEIAFKNRLFSLLRELPASDSLSLESMGYSEAFSESELWADFSRLLKGE